MKSVLVRGGPESSRDRPRCFPSSGDRDGGGCRENGSRRARKPAKIRIRSNSLLSDWLAPGSKHLAFLVDLTPGAKIVMSCAVALKRRVPRMTICAQRNYELATPGRLCVSRTGQFPNLADPRRIKTGGRDEVGASSKCGGFFLWPWEQISRPRFSRNVDQAKILAVCFQLVIPF